MKKESMRRIFLIVYFLLGVIVIFLSVNESGFSYILGSPVIYFYVLLLLFEMKKTIFPSKVNSTIENKILHSKKRVYLFILIIFFSFVKNGYETFEYYNNSITKSIDYNRLLSLIFSLGIGVTLLIEYYSYLKSQKKLKEN